MGTCKNLSNLCRLCSLWVECGFDIFIESDVKASLVILINKYLPIKVAEDDKLPKQICESCHIGVAATVDLIDRMVEGQHRLRAMYNQQVKLNKVDKRKSSQQKQKEEEYCGMKIIGPYLENKIIDSLSYQNLTSSEHIVTEIDRTIINPTSSSSVTKAELIDNLENGKLDVSGPITHEDNYPIKKEDMIPQTLINIQGNTPDIEMNDLAKGTEVKKVYGCHPLGLVVEGKVPKRKRGRPKKGENSSVVKTLSNQNVSLDEEITVARPKRRTNVPSRFRDSVAGKDFDELLYEGFHENIESDCQNLNDTDEGKLPLENEFNFPDYNFVKPKEKMHLLDGTTIIVTSNHQDEALSKMPATVNIELDFNETDVPTQEKDENGISRLIHTPKASVSAVQAMPKIDLSSRILENSFLARIARLIKPRRVKRGLKKKSKWFCEFCSKGFLHKGRYSLHMKLHKNVILQCEECKDRFSSKEDLTIHHEASNHKGIGIIEVENSEEKVTFKCPLCADLIFFSTSSYKLHVSSMHEGQKPYSCSLCDKRFAYKHSLKNHYVLHQPNKKDKNLPCKDCGKVFVRQSSLLYHRESVHNNGRKFVCSFCGCSFRHKQLLQRHYAVHSDERPHPCNICGRAFKTRGNLYNHMNTHTGTKKFTCELCGKQFSHATSLTLHLRSHTGEKPFECSFCCKRFTQSGNLQEHIRIHTGEKPYCCSVCGRKFTTSSQLKLHEKRHESEHKYKCSICFKGFFHKDNMLSHQRRHKAEKTFQCKQCDKIFSEKSSLSKHIKSHSEKGFKCVICGKIFIDSSLMMKHIQHHQIEKFWYVAQPHSVSDQEVIYVISKKEQNNLDFISFENDIFPSEPEDQGAENLNPDPSISNIPANFICETNQHSGSKVVFPNQLEVGESSFEISIKEESLGLVQLSPEDYTKLV